MRCPNTSCSWEGEGNFCANCGCKITDTSTKVTKCKGVVDGSPCAAEVKSTENFCKNCGTKVDPSWFASQKITCINCNHELTSGSKFCDKCGSKQQIETEGSENQTKGLSLQADDKCIESRTIGDNTNLKLDEDKECAKQYSDEPTVQHSVEPERTVNISKSGSSSEQKDENKKDSNLTSKADVNAASEQSGVHNSQTKDTTDSDVDHLVEDEDGLKPMKNEERNIQEANNKSKDSQQKEEEQPITGKETTPTQQKTNESKHVVQTAKTSQDKLQEKADQAVQGERSKEDVQDKYIHVRFHSLISHDIKFEPKKEDVLIRMSDDWENKDRRCNIVSHTKEHGYEMVYEMKIPLQPEHQRLEYKYYIVRPKKSEWESYYSVTNSEGNRTLVIPPNWKNEVVLEQFDGVVAKEWSSIYVFSSWSKELVRHAKRSAEYFCESILSRGNTVYSKYQELLLRLIANTKKTYFTDGNCWSLREKFVLDIGGSVMQGIANICKRENTEDRRTAIALLGISIANRIRLEFDQHKYWREICQSLIMQHHEKKLCLGLEALDKYFPDKRTYFKDAFVYVAKGIAKNPKDLSWMLLMPWVHFLWSENKPYEKPPFDLNHDSTDAAWWGIARMKDEVDILKGKSDKRDIGQTVKLLEPMFEIDYLLPRTLVATVKMDELLDVLKTQRIPLEISLAVLIFYHRTNLSSKEDKNAVECMKFLNKSCQKANMNSTVEQKKMSCSFAVQLLKESIKKKSEDLLIYASQTMVLCLSDYETACDSNDKQHREYSLSILDSCLPAVVAWFDEVASKKQMLKYLQVWDSAFVDVGAPNTNICAEWNKQISKALNNQLQRQVCDDAQDMKQFVELYCRNINDFSAPVQAVMGQIAFQAMEQGYSMNYRTLKPAEIKVFGLLLSDLFLDEWTRYEISEKSILHHFLRWSPFLQFVRVYAQEQDKLQLLSVDCHERLVQAVSVIELVKDELFNGKVRVDDLNLIKCDEVNFPEIAWLVGLKLDRHQHSQELITKAIQIRFRELEVFKNQAELMTTFSCLCIQLPCDVTKSIHDALKKQDNLGKHSVCEFCDPADVNKLDDLDNFEPKLCAFDVPNDVLSALPEINSFSKSALFKDLWKKECQRLTRERKEISLHEVLNEIWQPARGNLNTVVDKVRLEEIKFEEFDQHFGKTFKKNYDQLAAELRQLTIEEECIKNCLRKLKEYHHLEDCIDGAEAICNFAAAFELEGDFEPIQLILKNDVKNVEMKLFDSSLVETCEILRDITTQKIECLQDFTKCKALITWLLESMKEPGIQELNVLVDLALMSAGEEPMNITKVQCLHTAVSGYAPLIFDLKSTAGYRELLDLCEIVWDKLRENKDLPKMLVDTNRHLEWLKEIHQAHGSVEATSFMQAGEINSMGTYSVGKSEWTNVTKAEAVLQTNKNISLEISDVVSLRVHHSTEKVNKEMYSFSDLQDLQSRLMLIAGQSDKTKEKNVEKFTSVFDSVTRLGNVYIKLWSSGCLLFKDFNALFRCNPEQPVCVDLEFGEGQLSPSLKGRRWEEEDLKDFVPNIANCMELCLEEWLQHFKETRRLYFHLNYFTIDQLVILQRELVKIGVEDPSPRIFPLLSVVKENCSPDDLLQAMIDAKSEIEGVEGTDRNLEIKKTIPYIKELDDLSRDFVEELVDLGFQRNLAIKALQYIDPNDVDEGMEWCSAHANESLNQEPEELTVPEEAQKVQLSSKSTFSGWSVSAKDVQSLVTEKIQEMGQSMEVGSKPLINKLEALWNMFLQSVSSRIRDYVSLSHLGIILKHLALRETKSICRTFPSELKDDQPNLIVCPEGEVLFTALTIYLDQPLPQPDEVLLCTSNTTNDEIDIFFRRSIFSDCKKIYCLTNADALSYDVSEAAQKYLDEYLLEVGKDSKFRLVILCGSDRDFKSGLVSSLDRFRRQTLPVDVSYIRNYLAKRLVVKDDTITGIRPASQADIEELSARVVKSWRAGVGKTLYKRRVEEKVLCLNEAPTIVRAVSIPLQERTIDMQFVTERFLDHTEKPGQAAARLFHIDIAHQVQNGVDYLLFNLLVLGVLVDRSGYVWRKSPTDIYLIEILPLKINKNRSDLQYYHPILAVLPDITCRSPEESLAVYKGNQLEGYKKSDLLFDDKEFRSPAFQRTFQYLLHLDNELKRCDINPDSQNGSPEKCLETVLKHCGLNDPSWTEVHHFVWFFNIQLIDFEKNYYVRATEDLPGFATFVLKFLIQMSRDFSTRSLKLSEESPGSLNNNKESEQLERREDLQGYQMRRTWESSPHPYLFFNQDGLTFTFLGFYIDRRTKDLVDQASGKVLQKKIMDKRLYDALIENKVPLQENFDALDRKKKIMKLFNIMGVQYDPKNPHDPDDTYELTTDNVKKIMAIYMRLRCDIPVIIMGETGCGKTRLIQFMCSLQNPKGHPVTNMILMKVHGGITKKDIVDKVYEAEKAATENCEKYGQNMLTVLFFDEANTTEAIGLIKEIMCDKSVLGQNIMLNKNLKIVAACNPYRKHSDELIKKLEQAGLGYHVDAENTTDVFGHVPMRRLVYRVQPLPQSLLPHVWDFGQLSPDVEELYIRQMTKRYIKDGKIPAISTDMIEVLSGILTASQKYMRDQKDECSFVSLRDADRALTVMSWFYKWCNGNRLLFSMMDEKLATLYHSDTASSARYVKLDDLTRCLVLSLGVCYHACLKTREQYRRYMAEHFLGPCKLPGGELQFKNEIECCQEVFLDSVNLKKKIARNMALKENVFMMVVCIELRIPMFLVGKPGSSKSLAKTVVSDAMQGSSSAQDLFKMLKQVQMVSYQCSPLSTPGGIVSTFAQCARFQKDKNLDTFVSCVVLDEVGLAEDSPRMPLKTLHPLLEDGCQGNEEPEDWKKVAFIGISNWALDPAKMNRGILVQREVPDVDELKNTASGICESGELLVHVENMMEPMAKSYLEIFKQASDSVREFYGLRDFYSLMKMIYRFVKKSKAPPTWNQMEHAIRRNFGGMELGVDPEGCFRKHFAKIVVLNAEQRPDDLDNGPAGLIKSSLSSEKNDSRYLLLLTETYGAWTIIQQKIMTDTQDIHTVFGSSFKSDQEYTQLCRSINRIKICMETGKSVVLLNLENLYESLYDALNQYYVSYGGQRFVDLGLGTHRVKCPVHKKFRLIVVAEKQTVYQKFPIPLINRLEKHVITVNTLLNTDQEQIMKELKTWVNRFVQRRRVISRSGSEQLKTEDVFIGYHDDACAAVVLHVWDTYKAMKDEEQKKRRVFEKAKYTLLWCATPESIFTIKRSLLTVEEQEQVKKWYLKEQAHTSFIEFLQQEITRQNGKPLWAQVTTHSKLLSNSQKPELSKATGISMEKILLLETLSAINTEQQFTSKIKDHCRTLKEENDRALMVIQCDSGDTNANLIACARYCVRDELLSLEENGKATVHVIFIVQLPKGGYFSGFQCGVKQFTSAHIDDLYPEDSNMPTLQGMHGKSVADIFAAADKKSVVVDGLVLQCVQASLAMVKSSKTEDECISREMARVTLIRKLLNKKNETGLPSFFNGVCCLIRKLLAEKESSESVASMREMWMTNVAASMENVSRAGTFRRSCFQVLQGRVAPVLAGIVAFLDTNSNLSLLEETEIPWKKIVWLSFFNIPEALGLKYSDLQSPMKHSELQEIEVKSTGYEGHLFKARLPFSWIIIKQISEILTVDGFSEDSEHISVNILRDTPALKLLPMISKEKVDQDALKEYINDFVHTVYTASKETEYQIVAKMLHNFVVKRLEIGGKKHNKKATLLESLVMVHLCQKKIGTQLRYFRAINECSSVIVKLAEISPDSELFRDEEFTISAIELVLQDLAPQRTSMKDSKSRKSWLKQVYRCRPIVEQVLRLYGENVPLQEKVKEARRKWSHLVVIKLYLEQLCFETMPDTTILSCVTSFWRKKLKSADLKESLDVIEEEMKTYNNAAMKEHGFEGDCSQCERPLDGPPMVLPCSDIVCDQCAADLKTSGKNKCKNKQCFKDFDKTWEPVYQTKNDENSLEENLERYFAQAKEVLKSKEKSNGILEICVLVIQCLEDTLMMHAGQGPQEDIDFAIRALEKAAGEASGEFSVRKLYGLANARVGLTLLARVLTDIATRMKLQRDGCEATTLTDKEQVLVDMAHTLFKGALHGENQTGEAKEERPESKSCQVVYVRSYLVKVLCKNYGMHHYRELCLAPPAGLEWINFLDMDKVVEISDRFRVCGDQYVKVRQLLTRVVVETDPEELENEIKDCGATGAPSEVLLLLAMYREVTCSNLYPEEERKVTSERLQLIQHFVEKTPVLKNKNLIEAVVQNNLKPRQLVVECGADFQHQGLQCLVFHFLSVMSNIEANMSLLEPLATLMQNPQNFKDSFLPTMPQDDLEEFKRLFSCTVVGQMQQFTVDNEELVFYRCPNGHPYAIADCGRAWVTAKCNKCGADIGGTLHRLTGSNTQDFQAEPIQEKGHILGLADNRGEKPQAERRLTIATCSILRLILHMAMFTSAGKHPQAVCQMIHVQPAMDKDKVADFLWAHIHQDVLHIGNALGRSYDDVLLLMHVIMNAVMAKNKYDHSLTAEVRELSTKHGREEWECRFSDAFLQDTLKTLDSTVEENNQLLAQDRRLGVGALQCLLGEIDSQKKQDNIEMLHDDPRVWRYRAQVSLAHLRQETMSFSNDQHKILQMFVQEEEYLRVIRHIPSIFRLHRLLLQKYQRRLDKTEALQITVRSLKDELGQDVCHLIDEFADTWEVVRKAVKHHPCPTEFGPKFVGEEYCNQPIHDATPVSMLLPSTKEAGLCTYAALDFLFQKQNDFIQEYTKEPSRKSESIFSEVRPEEVTTAHLICYDLHDVQLMLLANCRYSFEIGKGTTTEYDFDGLEMQLMDRLLLSKAPINRRKLSQIDMMIYRTEFTNAAVFAKLEMKIRQEKLVPILKAQICDELKFLPEICQSLESLDIAISFLTSAGGQEDKLLHKFMSETLEMEKTIQSAKAQQSCELRHARSLWLLLSLQKCKLMSESRQHIKSLFENVPEEFCEEIPEEQQKQLEDFTRKLAVDKLVELLEALHEYILLQVSVKTRSDDGNDVDIRDNNLQQWFSEYVKASDEPPMDVNILHEFPEDIMLKHSVYTWMQAYSSLRVKQGKSPN